MTIGRAALPFLLLLAAAPPDEDAAHRADRLRTEALNARSATGYERSSDASVAADDQQRHDAARADYRRRLDAWRRRVAACDAGVYDACGG